MMAPVLMVEVARPQLQIGLSVFQNQFDGDNLTSPCAIPYLFFTLFQNQLSDEEHEQIIKDSNHHTGNVSIIHLHGILDIDVIVHLRQNVCIQVRKLLLSLHCPSSMGRFFVQVEKESDP